MNRIDSNFIDGLRDEGHAVVDELGISACECGDLMDAAVRFVDAALALAGCPSSGRAYIRFSCSRKLLFVEVTHLGPGTFNAVMADDTAMTALDELRAWARGSGRSLSIERGPRDQLRITVVLALGGRVLQCGSDPRELAAS
jgi:hypothetical protein